jgi:hypothetical protein
MNALSPKRIRGRSHLRRVVWRAEESNTTNRLHVPARDQGVNTRLVILGDGPLRHSLVARYRGRTIQYGIPRRSKMGTMVFTFLACVPNPYAYIANNYLVILSSAWEGFPLAVCEAVEGRSGAERRLSHGTAGNHGPRFISTLLQFRACGVDRLQNFASDVWNGRGQRYLDGHGSIVGDTKWRLKPLRDQLIWIDLGESLNW